MELLLEYTLCFFEYFTFFFVVFRKDFRKLSPNHIAGIVICCLIAFFGSITGWIFKYFLLPLPLFVPVNGIIFYLIFNISVKEIIALMLGEWLIICIMEMTVAIGLSPICPDYALTTKAVMLILSICVWLYYFIIGRKLNKTMFQAPIKIWFLLDGIMFLLTFMMEFFHAQIIANRPMGPRTVVIGKLLLISGGILICVLLFVMIYYFNQTQTFRTEKELAQMQSEQQREYFLRLLQKEDETRRFRHDIINDLAELQNYCSQQKYGKMEAYLTEVAGTIENIGKSCYDVGNDIVNTVLNYYLQPIKEICELNVEGYICEEPPISQRDLCTVCANPLKNAVEAVQNIPHGKISFAIHAGEQFLSIKVENTFDGEVLLKKNGLPKTTKADQKNHGIGLRNVVDVVNKYEGTYQINTEDGLFSIEIYLKYDRS